MDAQRLRVGAKSYGVCADGRTLVPGMGRVNGIATVGERRLPPAGRAVRTVREMRAVRAVMRIALTLGEQDIPLENAGVGADITGGA